MNAAAYKYNRPSRHRDWRNDIEGLGTLFSNHIPNYRNLMTSYLAKK